MIPAGLMAIVRCPLTGLPLEEPPPEMVARINARIARTDGIGLLNRAGQPVREALEGGLLCSDGSALYPVRGGIPVLLAEEAIDLPLP